ncbi:hypothetical protein ZIOFF_022827 [Zingiber officinale]|uniref:At2g24240-like C-terminal beta-propeller domain-containing protein n=1 Tax=Zingiber officinale TaxID=94328 RepID=A0A8J5LN10_ZINOF|nr:hypothetical protein ZIOFF_022827 [Zingiber officinale]
MTSTSELRHHFHITHYSQVKSFTVDTLSFSNADRKIFVSCKGRCNEYDIGVCDQDTSKQGVVWSWFDTNTSVSPSLYEKRIHHATIIKETRSICAVNQYDNLGFINLRSHAGGVQ